MIYILKHSKPDFTGYFGRAEFHKGQGSTSSKQDRDLLVKLGCKDISKKFYAEKKAREEKEAKAKAKAEAKKKKEEPETEKK